MSSPESLCQPESFRQTCPAFEYDVISVGLGDRAENARNPVVLLKDR